jgi:hypothetical protein
VVEKARDVTVGMKAGLVVVKTDVLRQLAQM